MSVVNPSHRLPPARSFAAGVPAITEYPPGATLGPREINDYEFVWLIRGAARLTVGGLERDLVPGVLYLLGPGVLHTFSWDPSQRTTHGYVHFGWPPDVAEPDGIAWPISRPFTMDDPMGALCRYLTWLSTHRPTGWSERVLAILEGLIDTFVNGPLPTSDESRWPAINAVLAHASNAWASGLMRRLTLGEMAQAAAVSKGHLNRIFHAAVGSSPTATIERIRLAQAERLLTRSSMTLGAVAEATGFADEYHLSRRFRRCFGIAPAAYRRLALTRDLQLPAEIVAILPLLDRP